MASVKILLNKINKPGLGSLKCFSNKLSSKMNSKQATAGSVTGPMLGLPDEETAISLMLLSHELEILKSLENKSSKHS